MVKVSAEFGEVWDRVGIERDLIDGRDWLESDQAVGHNGMLSLEGVK